MFCVCFQTGLIYSAGHFVCLFREYKGFLKDQNLFIKYILKIQKQSSLSSMKSKSVNYIVMSSSLSLRKEIKSCLVQFFLTFRKIG